MNRITPLIFKQSKSGRKGYKVDDGTVEHIPLKKFINSNLLRNHLSDLPEVTEFQVVMNATSEDTQRKIDKALKRNLVTAQ